MLGGVPCGCVQASEFLGCAAEEWSYVVGVCWLAYGRYRVCALTELYETLLRMCSVVCLGEERWTHDSVG
jgi:hypothetical protein